MDEEGEGMDENLSGEEMMEQLAIKITQVKDMREHLGQLYEELNLLKIKIDRFCQKS